MSITTLLLGQDRRGQDRRGHDRQGRDRRSASEIKTTTRSLRGVRMQARIPRAIALIVVLILCIAGLRAIVARPTTTVVTRQVAGVSVDQGAEDFAQTFAHIFLTWNPNDQGQRQNALAPYLSSSLDQDAGFQPADGTSESVQWTSVVGEQASANETLVTVAAMTSNGMEYLNVPVSRDSNGFLFISDYPAFVGPPATDPNASLPTPQEVTDSGLQTVVARAVTNYLAGSQGNLLADLTPNALVSLPAEHLTVTNTQQATWVVPGHRVDIQVNATDSKGNSFTLSYQLSVEKLDRWYVQSIQVNPTFTGGTS